MAENDYPILVFPAPALAERARRFGGGGRPRRPEAGRQGERLAPKFRRLGEALANRRLALQGSSLGIEPEQVLVLETVGPIASFIRAVEKVEGLEWLGEYELEDIPPRDGFEDARDPERSLSGQLFLVMSDGRALAELRSLFNLWRRDPEARFSRGLAPLKHAFEHLLEIRPWDVEDRLADTGLLEDWNDRAAFGQETVSFEAELWYRHSERRRRAAAEQIGEIVAALGGAIVDECAIEEIAYHAILGRIDITRIRDLLNRPETRREVELLRCDDIMFLRPVGQCAAPIGDEDETEESDPGEPPDSERRTGETPVVMLTDETRQFEKPERLLERDCGWIPGFGHGATLRLLTVSRSFASLNIGSESALVDPDRIFAVLAQFSALWREIAFRFLAGRTEGTAVAALGIVRATDKRSAGTGGSRRQPPGAAVGADARVATVLGWRKEMRCQYLVDLLQNVGESELGRFPDGSAELFPEARKHVLPVTRPDVMSSSSSSSLAVKS